ncbi:FkbM family methyltransferase [Phyllobacterium sp. 1468]|uniref:FkbM family methyltransferase n=1 Tax=Phyllobacterium sp. 1468 TaxID=2817759 RepID=UPI0028661BDC|nr:FkbM family methyltransferase [Phyllobacterium sp. 1468]MDR6635018.1 FkbM family methyltransferase [Phyllobacterium sp. 1468]
MTLISRAQNFEDVILWRALKHINDGSYVDIGAQDPLVDSVSEAFYRRGWRGVHVEPIHFYAEKLRIARPDETVIEGAVGQGSANIPLYEIEGTGMSTGKFNIAETHRLNGHSVKKIDVPCIPLSELFLTHIKGEIHWMKLDVEGMEQEVIESWEPVEVRPWIIVVESTEPNLPVPNHQAWEPQLLAKGYEFVYFDGLNRFYVSNDHSELKAVFGPGPNVFDNFVRGTEFDLRVSLNAQTANADMLAQQVEQVRAEKQTLAQQLAIASAENEKFRQQISGLKLQNESYALQLDRIYSSRGWILLTRLKKIIPKSLFKNTQHKSSKR